MPKILLVLQHNGQELTDSSARLAANINRLTRLEDPEIATVIFGSDAAKDNYLLPEQRAQVIGEISVSIRSDLIILPNTLFSREVSPILAIQLEAGLISNCVDLSYRNERWEVIVDVYNGQYQMVCEVTGKTAVVLAKDVSPGDVHQFNSKEVKVIEIEQINSSTKESMEVIETFYLPAVDLDIDEADIVVGIGRGVETPADYQMMEEFAGRVGSPLGGSRPAVDFEWIPVSKQIGQTGRIIAPELYIAVGISGAQQHISGVEKAKILAINNDPQAPILRAADLGVIGDFREIVPILNQKLKEFRRGKSSGEECI